jgi:hypothetical protein
MLVELMFYQSKMICKDLPMYIVEARFYEIFDELTIDDIGVICLAFFRSEKKFLNNPLVNKIFKKVRQTSSNFSIMLLIKNQNFH